MADRYRPDLLGPLQTGFNIRQAKDRADLAREKHDINLGQLARENKRVEEDRKRVDDEYEYSQGIREVNVNKQIGDIEGMNRGFRRSMTAAGMEVPEDMPIGQEVYDEWIKVTSMKDPADQDIAEENFAKRFGESVGAFGRKAKTFGADVGAFEASQKTEATIAGEQRTLGTQKELETFKTEEAIRQKGAEITATTEALTQRPAKGKVQTLKIGNKAYERQKNGRWKLVLTGPETAGKKSDKEMRELNLMEKINKQITKEADDKFDKLVARQEYSDARGTFTTNTEYDFEGRRAYITARKKELSVKAGISEVVFQALTGDVSPDGEVAGPPLPPETPIAPATPDIPAETFDRFNTEGLDAQGYTLGNLVTEGQWKGYYEVLDASGKPVNYYQ